MDILTRHGSLTIPNIFGSLKRDIMGISEILELIQNSNRENNSQTQVYLCGAPRIMNTVITDLAMNPELEKYLKNMPMLLMFLHFLDKPSIKLKME